MCGIFAVCHAKCSKAAYYSLEEAKKRSKRQRHRGPDFDGYYQDAKTGDILCHERLAIVDLHAHQPLQGTTPNSWVVHNGEIYNHTDLRENELHGVHMRSTCDSEVIIFLFEKVKSGMMCNMLDGIFAFALVHDGKFLAARDPLGIKQMYYGVDKDGRYMFCNEMKCIEDCCGQYEMSIFPPGHYWTPEEGFVRYYTPKWTDFRNCVEVLDLRHLHDALIKSVHKRLMSDAPMGVLLSGGLDSSLVSSIAAREMKDRGLAVHSFSIGTDASSPDVIAARKVADHIGTQHHEYYFTIEEGIKNLRNLIWHLETYDVTSIRASTPMYFLSGYIREMGIKSVLSGEGADEIFGGYLYFHNAPTDEDFLKETIERVLNLNTADCLRADKSSMAQSLEVRVPFLDKEFVRVAMLTAPQFKRAQRLENGRRCEKYALRQAFNADVRYDLSDDPAIKHHPYLPDEILWRQKEQFSDGVGYNWIDKLMEYCAEQISDNEFAQAEKMFPINTPHSKEAYYMRKTFHELFPSERAAMTVRKWIPKWQKNIDPSGRASTIHESTKEKQDAAQETTDLKRRIVTTKADMRSEQHA